MEWIRSSVDGVAQTWVGRAVLRQLDTFLWVVEKSAEWSLPRNEGETEESATTKTDLVRPLPWALFLATLVMLRAIRVSLNTGASMLGFPRVSSLSMVRFAQRSRDRLATIGKSSERARFKRDAEDERLSMNQAKKALIRSIRLTLSTLSCLDGSKPSLSPPPTRIRVSALDAEGTESTTAAVPKGGGESDGASTAEDEPPREERDSRDADAPVEATAGRRVDEEVECDQVKGEGERECDKAECDLIEKEVLPQQDSDARFFSPVESSASRSRSSSDSRYSNVSTDSHRRNPPLSRSAACGNGEARFVADEASEEKIEARKSRCSSEESGGNNCVAVGKRGANAAKYHHHHHHHQRGKRTSHGGNRKRK